MAIKEKDFIELEYTGKLKEDNFVFDTTDEAVAKENDIHNPQMPYGPVIICVGAGSILPGLEKNLMGKEPGRYKIELKAEDAFGKKDAKLLKIINTNVFKKAKIDPMPGLQVNIDGTIGLIKTVTGGRTVVDFNHPLSGKDVVYDVNISRMVTDSREKISALVSMQFNLKPDAFEVKIDEKNVAGIKFKEGIKLKHFSTGKMRESLIQLVGVKDAVFVETSPEKFPKPEEKQKETTPK